MTHISFPRILFLIVGALFLVACGGVGGSADVDDGTGDDELTTQTIECELSEHCDEIVIQGDAPDSNPGVFKGFADPTLARDPDVEGRYWLAYSWPHVVDAKSPLNFDIQLAAVSNHLARSDDGGKTFTFVDILWSDYAIEDPEGGGDTSRMSTETASLIAVNDQVQTTWYGAHLSYYLEPKQGYNPRYGTSVHVRIGAAASPLGLATADEAVLGVSTTADAYSPNERLDQLAGLPIQHCGFVNNPDLFVADGVLYLIVECLAFIGQEPDYPNTTTQVFATAPVGSPTLWSWYYVGKLADHDLALELGADTLIQPDVTEGPDGKTLALFTTALTDDVAYTGTVGDGCVAIEMSSINPPVLARDNNGDLKIHARITGEGFGSCTGHSDSATGIITTLKGSTDGNWTLHAAKVP